MTDSPALSTTAGEGGDGQTVGLSNISTLSSQSERGIVSFSGFTDDIRHLEQQEEEAEDDDSPIATPQATFDSSFDDDDTSHRVADCLFCLKDGDQSHARLEKDTMRVSELERLAWQETQSRCPTCDGRLPEQSFYFPAPMGGEEQTTAMTGENDNTVAPDSVSIPDLTECDCFRKVMASRVGNTFGLETSAGDGGR